MQAAKMSDVWPIENVWAILKQDLNKVEIKDVKTLRREIKKSWCRISKDKELCKKLIGSIPKRLQAVIRKEGGQIFKSDY